MEQEMTVQSTPAYANNMYSLTVSNREMIDHLGDDPDATLIPEEYVLHDFRDGNGEVLAFQHPKGRGWIAKTADVSKNSYVGQFASVFGDAMVLSNSSVLGTAKVYGSAYVSSRSTVCGNAQVFDKSCVMSSLVTDDSIICGSSTVTSSTLRGDSKIVDAIVEHVRGVIYAPWNIYGFRKGLWNIFKRIIDIDN